MTPDESRVESVLGSALQTLQADHNAALDDEGKNVVRGWAAANRGKIAEKLRAGWDNDKFASVLGRVLRDAKIRHARESAQPVATAELMPSAADNLAIIPGTHVQTAFDECPNC
jgi:hypothetical protein